MNAPTLTELEFYDDGHRYLVRGRELPSVTTLMRKYGLGFQGFAPQEALDRGQYVHAASVLVDENDLDEASVPAKWAGYIEAYRRWLSATRSKPVVAERRLFSPEYGFAGTFDRVIFRDGKRMLIEYKTGDTTDWNVQAGGYERLWSRWYPSMAIEAGEGLLLNANGTYNREPLDLKDGWRIFSACLVIEEQRRKHARRVANDAAAA